MTQIVVRPIDAADRAAWSSLWADYLAFYRHAASREVFDTTWQRLLDPGEPVHGLLAAEEDRPVGLAHFLFHRNTWMVEPVCYLQDLFTAPETRGRGVGRQLIEAVSRAATLAGSSRLYWLTHETNATAMALYDRVAERSGFVQYRRSLGQAVTSA